MYKNIRLLHLELYFFNGAMDEPDKREKHYDDAGRPPCLPTTIH